MPGKIENAQQSDMASNISDYEVSSLTTDGVTSDIDETTWQNEDWSKQYGYFCQVPDLKSAILMKATWLVGKGYTTDSTTKVILDHITGYGKENFTDILLNMVVSSRIGGDSFAEIIKDDDGDVFNLKVLDPSSIKIHTNKKGIITKYTQTSKTKKGEITFKPDEILHFCHNRVADSIHGLSDIDAVEKTILADEESFDDTKRLMHWQARPLILFKLKTDNTAKITAFVNKMDTALGKGENVYIPDDENILTYDIVQVNPNSSIFQWRDETRNRFYRTIGLPQIVPGAGGQSSESESKVIYLAFEQIVAKEQADIENTIWQQLQYRIKLNSPISLMDNLQTDTGKDAGITMKPSE